MSEPSRDERLIDERRAGLWCYLVVALLGVWLAASPFTFGYGDPDGAAARVAKVTAARALSPIADRLSWLAYSDVISGLLLVTLGLLSLRGRRLWAPWAACAIGVWVSFAPIVLWAPSAAAYGNEVPVGTL